jgi:hypothetical protein
VRQNRNAFTWKIDDNRDYSKLKCRTLMMGGVWQVPEDQRPPVAPPPVGLKEGEYRATEIIFDLHKERAHSEYGEYAAVMARRSLGRFGRGGNGAGVFIRNRDTR